MSNVSNDPCRLSTRGKPIVRPDTASRSPNWAKYEVFCGSWLCFGQVLLSQEVGGTSRVPTPADQRNRRFLRVLGLFRRMICLSRGKNGSGLAHPLAPGRVVGIVVGLTVTRSALTVEGSLRCRRFVHHVQIAPTATEITAYDGLMAAAAAGDADRIRRLLPTGANIDERDARGRTPLMVAIYGRHHDAAKTLIALDADDAALDNQRYDASPSPASSTIRCPCAC